VAKTTILVVEDDRDIQELLSYNLAQEGFQVLRAMTGEDGLQIAKNRRPGLIILDLMLPGMEGMEVCRRIKRNPDTAGIPIVMLTAKGEDADIITGLEVGADDYVTKPFSPKVLIARVRAVLRRKEEKIDQGQGTIQFRGLEINLGRHEVKLDGKQLTLTLTEFRILQLLTTRPGWVYSRSQIVEFVRGEGYPVTERAVDVQIVGLRKKLGTFGNRIATVRGVGYKLEDRP